MCWKKQRSRDCKSVVDTSILFLNKHFYCLYYFLGVDLGQSVPGHIIMGIWLSRLEESQISDCKVRLWFLSEQRNTMLTKASGSLAVSCKPTCRTEYIALSKLRRTHSKWGEPKCARCCTRRRQTGSLSLSQAYDRSSNCSFRVQPAAEVCSGKNPLHYLTLWNWKPLSSRRQKPGMTFLAKASSNLTDIPVSLKSSGSRGKRMRRLSEAWNVRQPPYL
jgi:hypothetical protein